MSRALDGKSFINPPHPGGMTMIFEIIDSIHSTIDIIEPPEPFDLIADDGGHYTVTLSGDFGKDGSIAIQLATDPSASATMRVFTEPGHYLIQLKPGSYRVLIDRVAKPVIVVCHVPERKLFSFGGHSDLPRPDRMNDAGFTSGWLDRYGFALIEGVYIGMLTPAAAREIIDRHFPPLSVTPDNIDPSYMPEVPAPLILAPNGRVIDGAVNLCAVVARDQSVAATITLERT